MLHIAASYFFLSFCGNLFLQYLCYHYFFNIKYAYSPAGLHFGKVQIILLLHFPRLHYHLGQSEVQFNYSTSNMSMFSVSHVS